MQPRKYITVQRSAHKESPKASYQNIGYRQAYDTNFHGGRFSSSNTNLLKIRDQPDKIKYQELHKTPSQSNFKTRQQQIKSNIARKRGDGMVSNLKSQLLNLKMEVSKLTNKQRDTDNKIFTYKRGSIQAVDDDLDNQSVKSSSSNNYAKQISDTISVTSQKIIDEPLRRLESKFSSGGYDHGHYMELQNDLLKTQLRNLKNKYNATKQQLKQKYQALQRKNQYLEVSLRRSDQALTQCKKSLQVQLQTIKFQVSRKLQQQYQDEQKKNQRSIQPVRDSLGNNQLVQQKLNKLYEQLSDKTKMISSINIQYNQLKGQFEKKSFELKKQLQKNSQLSKQLQFSKRQNLRNKNLLEIEVNKKNQLNKTIETLKQKNNQMSKQLHLQNSIVTDSQQLQNKYAKQLQQHKQNEEKLQQQNYELKNQIKKQKQLIDSHEQQIKHLKKTINDFTSQLQQASKNLRIQKQKSIQLQQTYRKLLDQAKQSGQKQLQILQQQYDNYRQSSRQITSYTDLQQPKQKQNMIKKQKDRQISRWKTEYKMLKIKYDENLALQQNKKQQLEEYYKNYKQYKTKNKILEMRNKILQESANSYIQKIQKIESQNLQQRVMNLQKNNRVALENQQLQRKIQEMQEQFNQLRNALQIEIQRANSQQNYRKQLQKSILNINLTQSAQKMPSQNLQTQKLQQLIQTIQKIRKKLSDQDQKINKNIKQLKTKDNLIKQLKKQIKNLLQNQQNQLQKFRIKQITQYMQQIKLNNNISLQQSKKQYKKQLSIQINNNKQLLQQNNNIKKQKNNLQNQVNKLKQEIKNITYLYNIKQTQYIHILQQKQQDRKYNINKIQQIENNKNKRIRYLQNQISNKKQQIQNNRMQIKRYLTMRNNVQIENFDQALKNQIEAAKRYREELSKKNQQIYRIRDTYAILKTQLDNLKSQSDIAKLKFISDKKNIQIQFDVQSQNLKSQLSLQQKKVISLQQKIKLVIDQNKKKDNFIQTYIMGKKLPTNQRQLVATFIKQYQICLKGKEISEKLQAESQELQKLSKYNLNLMKEIAEMKEKLLMYQAIQNDGVYTENQYNTNDKQLLTSKSLIKSHNSLEAKEFD